MNNTSFIGLVQNAALLLALVVIFDVVALRWRVGQISLRQAPIGLVLGAIGIAVMLTPWQFTPGIVFDTRSVLLSISGLFFGAVPTALAMAMTAAFRLYLGGGGAWTGVSVILATGTLGIAWRHQRRRPLAEITWRELYLFGIVSHLVMLALMFTLPWETARQVLTAISLPVLVIYPLATATLGALLVNRLRRERTMEALRESEERFRLLYEQAPLGYQSLNEDGCFIEVNQAWLDMLGYARAEVIGRWFGDFLASSQVELFRQRFPMFKAAGVVHSVEFEMLRRDGAHVIVAFDGRIGHDDQGRFKQTHCIMADITERKRAEEALAISERRFRGLAESSQDYIMLYDRECRHVYENPAALRVSGFTEADIIGKTHRQAGFSEELSALWEADIQGVFASGTSTRRLFDWESAEGKVYLDWRLAPVLGADGKVELVLGISRDITALKRAEEQAQAAQVELQRLLATADQSRRALLSVVEDQKRAEEAIRTLNAALEQRVRDRTARLEAANQELEAFAYSVSHDLRAPLRALDGFSAALLVRYAGQLDEQGQHYLDRIQQASQRMGQLINDLLNLSRVTRAELTCQRVDLAALAREITAELQGRDPQRQAEFRIADHLDVQGDPRLLHIVLQNLLENAWKFTGPHPQARIEVGQMTIADCRLAISDSSKPYQSAIENPKSAIYFVRDNGVGFDMAYAAKLFAPFQRLHAMDEFPGTGIGLATVQRIITRHGGRIWAEAAVDGGATFYFTLGGQ